MAFDERYMDEESLALFLNWEQTDEDRSAIREFFADSERVAAQEAVARRIAATDTVSERIEVSPLELAIAALAEAFPHAVEVV